MILEIFIFSLITIVSVINVVGYNYPPSHYNYNSQKRPFPYATQDHYHHQCPPLQGPNVKYFKRDYSYGNIAPDNYIQRAILTNGQFPGEPISVYSGETVVVEVCNYIDHPLTIHFHGILQRHTVRSDGVPFVTQNPIQPSKCYFYVMKTLQQVGTFIYHAHTELDIIWAFGAFIIQENPNKFYNLYSQGLTVPLKSTPGYKYDEEKILILTQCWHASTESMVKGVTGAPFADIPDTDSILINGVSYGVWDNKNGNSNGYKVILVEQGKCYRFRVIGLGSDSMLRFEIEEHSLKVIEMDGIITDPVVTDHLNVNTGQRYSCIVCMNRTINNYKIRVVMMPGPGPNNGHAILHYRGAPDVTPLRKQIFSGQSDELPLERWILDELHPSYTYHQDAVYPTPLYIDKSFTIQSFQRTNADGSKQFLINGQFVQVPNATLIDTIQNSKFPIPNPSQVGLMDIHVVSFIEIIFINSVGTDGSCEQHPWHLHGHTFHIVGEGQDGYNPFIEGALVQRNIENKLRENKPNFFQFRDVMTLFPNSTSQSDNLPAGTPCGWIAIRFKADNPGLWMVHCHLTAHLMMGKRFVLYEHTNEDPSLHEQCYYTGRSYKIR